MAFWLRSEERRVGTKARAVQRDLAAIARDRSRIVDRVRTELGRPRVTLAVFAAGLGYGWARGRRRPERGPDEEGATRTGRFAQVLAAVVAGARLYEQARRAAGALGELEPRRSASGDPPSPDVVRY
jgi:hypothetical protein